jgi:hypothetical protein
MTGKPIAGNWCLHRHRQPGAEALGAQQAERAGASPAAPSISARAAW